MTEKKQRINVSIPVELYSKISDSEYGLTEAIIKGLELILSPEIKTKPELLEQQELKIKELQEKIEKLKLLEIKPEILELQETRIKELQNQIKANDNNQQARLEEMQDHNETLKKELEDLKQIHTNYMLQMQTVINQRAIEAPGAKKPWWQFW
jgi:alanyl-tRNA synthetase